MGLNYVVHAETLEDLAGDLSTYISHVEGDLDGIRDQLEEVGKHDAEDFDKVVGIVEDAIDQIDELRKTISR